MLPIQFPLFLLLPPHSLSSFFLKDAPTTEIYTLSLHDALPIWQARAGPEPEAVEHGRPQPGPAEIEEHTSELQSRFDLVCRLLLEKKKKNTYITYHTRCSTNSS